MKPVFAAVNIADTPLGQGTVATQFPTINVLINIILKNSLTIISVLLVVLLLIGGLQFIIGAGGDDPKKAQAAKAMITDAIIGFVIVFSAYFIIQIIETITGTHIINPIL